MKNTTLVKNKKGAFSLVEMLVVIAVIGILAAIAVPNIGKINGAAENSKDRRNAQQLSSVCNAAAAAGYDFIEENSVADGANTAGLKALCAKIVTGESIGDTTSPFYGSFFGVPNLSDAELTGAVTYLDVDNGMLVYKSNL